MLDRYDNPITTTQPHARDAYVRALDLMLAGDAGITVAFQDAIDADPGFALGHAGLARGRQFAGDMPGAKSAMQTARGLTKGLTPREASHIDALGLLIDGQTAAAYTAIRAHVDAYPRDALIAQTCSSVFGLIGFSGQPGREAEILAFTAALMPHYGDDWWCTSQYAFALCENGALDKADTLIGRSLAQQPRNANGAHVRSHIYYEQGAHQLGIGYLNDWITDYDRGGYIYGHLSWHAALWSLEQGDVATMWQRIDQDLHPDICQSLPINTLTDLASLLYRAELAGQTVPASYWQAVSTFANRFFPKTSIGFIDIHAALSHAMAGDNAALSRLIENPNPLTGDVATPVAQAFGAIAAQDWPQAVALLSSAMSDHARLGGSRAQRDVLELALLSALLKIGKDEEARRLLTLRRPVLAQANVLHGLAAH